MLKLAFRNLFRHKVRTRLTLAAIAFGVTVIILSGGFVEDMFVQLRESTIHSQVGHIQVYKTGYYSQGRRDPYHYLIQNPDLLAQQLSKLPHVKKVMERLQFSATLNNTQADLPVQGEGVEADKESEFGGAVTWSEGRALTDGDAYGIVLGEGVARALQLQPGDYATLLVSAPGGVLNSLDFKVVGVFHTYQKITMIMPCEYCCLLLRIY